MNLLEMYKKLTEEQKNEFIELISKEIIKKSTPKIEVLLDNEIIS